MRYAKLKLMVASVVALPLALGALAFAAQAQEPIQVEPPAPVEQPPVHVLEPKGSSEAPVPMEGAAGNADGAVAPDASQGAQAPAGQMDGAPGGAPAAGTLPAAAAAPSTDTATLADLVGMPVVDSEGKKVGIVTDVKMNAEGGVKEIHVRTAGFFGLGSKTLAVPSGIIAQTEKTVTLKMVSADLGKLPLVKAPKS